MADSYAQSISTTTSEQQGRSTFQRALNQYLQSLSEKSTIGSLIEACTSGGEAVTAESINECIKKAERKKTSRQTIANLLSPVVTVMKDFEGVISTLIAADPMPTALIWGALKVGAYRFTNLFETIRTQLGLLTAQLKRINEYEELYGDSERMQDLLCNSYINMFRFWNQVNKECDRCRASVFSFRINKLNNIISDLQFDADQIWKQGLIIESSRASDERQYRKVEDNKAVLDRIEAQKARRSFQEWRAEQQAERHAEHYRRIHSWIGFQEWNEVNNSTRHRENKKTRQNGTCDWLARHSTYSVWQNGITDPSVLWLHSPPGFGKTILCSHAIQLIKDSDPGAAVVYHFYREEHHTGCETLRILAGQLFESYVQRSTQVDEELYLKTQRRACSLENVQELITSLVKYLPKTYIFIDGLDQEASPERWTEALTVLDYLLQLGKNSPEKVRIWYSSQSRPRIKKKLEEFVTLNINDQLDVKTDVMLYLSWAMSQAHPELDELWGEKDTLLKALQDRAEGNFLCASLMIKVLQEDTDSLTDMKEFIEHGDLPKTLDDYYRRIFERIVSSQRRLACHVFALIAFARRPLQIKELREAVGLLQSKTPQAPKATDMPFLHRLQQLFAPLVEVQQGSSDDNMDNSTCRFFHSTVREFLVRNPSVLSEHLPITQRIIADACLGYLSQSRYSRLLTASDTEWIDMQGETVERHYFLRYAAKYWDKQLDHIPESEELHGRVLSFITSSNFLTCIQVQSLWVEHKFAVFGITGQEANHSYLLRVFPAWFTPRAEDLWKDYRRFMHDWRHLLTCENGEVDRCWWAALGTRNFLSRSQGRYTSFMFQADENVHQGSWQGFYGVGAMGDELKKLRLHSRTQDTLEFICEHWSLSAGNNVPTLEKTQTILVETKATKWDLYDNYSDEKSTVRVGKAAPAMFSPDCRFLRIGVQLFALDGWGSYISIQGLDTENEIYPAYIEEFTSSPNRPYIVFATRRNNTKGTRHQEIRDGRNDGSGAKTEEDKIKATPTSDQEDDQDSSADSESDSSRVSSTDSNDRGYETWSECSTEHDDKFEDDIIAPWTGPVNMEEGDFSDSSESSNEETKENSSDTNESAEPGSDSSSEDSDLPISAIVGYGRWHSDDEDYDKDGEQQLVFARRPLTRSSRDLRASLTVIDRSCSVPRRIFRFSYIVSSMLYDSPPALHPSKPLVVWPLGGGDVLFADFMANSYFVRKLRPSTSHTRHIFMKCHFSSCGRYLHIASLEVQRKPASRSQRNAEQDPLKIALLLSTYRLCGHKTTKSPPTLIHRAKVHVGFRKSLSVSDLPYTLTWTSDELYFTCSAEILRVYRIRLFSNPNDLDETWSGHSVLMPRETLFLPRTASQREVYYFPPPKGSTVARIIVGGEGRVPDEDKKEKRGEQEDTFPGIPNGVVGLEGNLSPPVGCYLDEAEDLGGWWDAKDSLNIPEALGIGRLDRRREKFDYDDDCDLEPYIF